MINEISKNGAEGVEQEESLFKVCDTRKFEMNTRSLNAGFSTAFIKRFRPNSSSLNL